MLMMQTGEMKILACDRKGNGTKEHKAQIVGQTLSSLADFAELEPCRNTMVNTAWDRELCSFIFVDATVLD